MQLTRVLFAAALLVPVCGAVTIGQIDTFESETTENWFAGGLGPPNQLPPVPPTVINTGGPEGDGDAYLQLTGFGGAGPGSRIVAINLSQWTGNFLRISGIRMDLRNFSSSDLTIRLMFENPMLAPPTDIAISTAGVLLPANSGWVSALFPIAPSDLTALQGNAATALAEATLVRIFHSSTASFPEPQQGVLGLDNIQAIPEPGSVLLLFSGFAAFAMLRRRP